MLSPPPLQPIRESTHSRAYHRTRDPSGSNGVLGNWRTHSPQRAKTLWQHGRIRFERRNLEMCNGERATLQWEAQKSEPGLVLSDVALCQLHPAQAGVSVLSWDTMGTEHLASKGQPGAASRDPHAARDLAGHFTPACVAQAHSHLEHPPLPWERGARGGPRS